MVPVTEERFEQLAADGLDALPDWVREQMENVEVMVQEHPPPGQPNLLGLYHGVPLTSRGAGYGVGGTLPDTITLYRSTITNSARDEQDLVRLVRRVVAHEVAHHFGISDERLHELDAY